MQISTRDKDFVVDTIALREELYILNEVFTDPSILKVNIIIIERLQFFFFSSLERVLLNKKQSYDDSGSKD